MANTLQKELERVPFASFRAIILYFFTFPPKSQSVGKTLLNKLHHFNLSSRVLVSRTQEREYWGGGGTKMAQPQPGRNWPAPGPAAAPLGNRLKWPQLSLPPFQKHRLVWRCPGQEPLTFRLIPTMSESPDQAMGARRELGEGLRAAGRTR